MVSYSGSFPVISAIEELMNRSKALDVDINLQGLQALLGKGSSKENELECALPGKCAPLLIVHPVQYCNEVIAACTFAACRMRLVEMLKQPL